METALGLVNEAFQFLQSEVKSTKGKGIQHDPNTLILFPQNRILVLGLTHRFA